mmetsp:Transcript_70116/g.186822  ORF Transcript_70116/g.186822 Transcript_70116/m.186822 type:complete len:210 (-) Transcript_70116:561-1190(-)
MVRWAKRLPTRPCETERGSGSEDPSHSEGIRTLPLPRRRPSGRRAPRARSGVLETSARRKWPTVAPPTIRWRRRAIRRPRDGGGEVASGRELEGTPDPPGGACRRPRSTQWRPGLTTGAQAQAAAHRPGRVASPSPPNRTFRRCPPPMRLRVAGPSGPWRGRRRNGGGRPRLRRCRARYGRTSTARRAAAAACLAACRRSTRGRRRWRR